MAYEVFDQESLYQSAKDKSNVTTIMSHIKKYSLSKLNRYFIEFTLPQAVLNYISTRDKTFTRSQQDPRINLIKLNCIQVTYPQKNFTFSDTTSSAHEERVPLSYDLSPISLSFYAFADMKEKLIFDYWMDLILSPKERTVMFLDEIVCPELRIIQMDAKNVPKYGVKLQKVLPSQVTAIQLDSQASELPIRVDVTLAYMYLENFDYQVEDYS